MRNDIRQERIETYRKRQVEVADHLAARIANRLREQHDEVKHLDSMSDLERAAKKLPLRSEWRPAKTKVVPEGERLICRHCKQEILVEKWEWCAEAQKNLRSWGAIVVDGKVVRG